MRTLQKLRLRVRGFERNAYALVTSSDLCPVRDYDRLRPTLVYNCKYVPALCNNVRAYLGVTGPTASMSGLHYDSNGARVSKRRKTVCLEGENWIEQMTNGRNRCPEPDQPSSWKYKKCTKHDKNNRCLRWENGDAPQETLMLQTTDPTTGAVTIDKNQLAKKGAVKYNQDGTSTQKYLKMGAVMSCDEWPAAR